MKISSLAKYVNETNNCTKDRNGVVDTITIHCTASANENKSSRAIVDYFASTTREASCNYAVGGNDANDISCGVREEYRAWTSGGNKTVCGESGSMNDHHAITIEVVSNIDGSIVKEQAIENTISLCVDICQRYGKTKAIWFGDNAEKNVSYIAKDNEMKFTWHRWFANKSCPGPYIMSKFQYIIDEINKRLNNSERETKMKKVYKVQVGSFDKEENAKAYMNELKAKGINCFVVEVEEKETVTPTTPSTIPTLDNKTRVKNYLEKRFNHNVVCGIMANLNAESGYNPSNLQNNGNQTLGISDEEFSNKLNDRSYPKNKFITDGYGYGLVQWTWHSRKEYLYNYMEANGYKFNNLEGQLEFMLYEMKNYIGFWNFLNESESAYDVAYEMCMTYEAPANKEVRAKERANAANALLKELYNETPKTPTTTTPTTPVKKELKEGDVIKLKQGCTYYNGKSIPSWVFNKTLYYRGKNSNGVIFSTLKTGAITGVVKEENIVK